MRKGSRIDGVRLGTKTVGDAIGRRTAQSGASQGGEITGRGRGERGAGWVVRDDIGPEALFLQPIQEQSIVMALDQKIGPERCRPLTPGERRYGLGGVRGRGE